MYVQMCVAGGGVRWGMGRERDVGKRRGVWKDAVKRGGFLLLIKNYFIRLRIYMTKKKASLPFNISSSCFSNALKEPKGRGKGKGRQDYRGQGQPWQLTTTRGQHQRTSASGPRSSYRFPNLISSAVCLPFGEGNGTPLEYSCLENPMDGGPW